MNGLFGVKDGFLFREERQGVLRLMLYVQGDVN